MKKFEVGHRYLSAEEFAPFNVTDRTEKSVYGWFGWEKHISLIDGTEPPPVYRKKIRHDDDGNEFIVDSVPEKWRDQCCWNAKWDVEEWKSRLRT